MMPVPALSTRCRSRRSTRSKRVPRLSSWLTMISDAPAASSSANSRSRKACWRSRSRAEVGSSATISSGRPIRARAAATRCCWPTLRLEAETPSSSAASRPRLVEQSQSFGLCRLAASGSLPAFCCEAQRQQHVVEDRAVGQQIEHLKNDAHVLGAKLVPRRVRQLRDIRAQDVEASRLRRDDAGEQAQERGLAAAGRADQQHALARFEGEVVDRNRERSRSRPGEAHARHRHDAGRRADSRLSTIDDVHVGPHIMPPRSSEGLSRVTSYLFWALAVTTLTVSPWAPANDLK